MTGLTRRPGAPGFRVFSVDDRAVQLMWSGLPGSECTVTIGDQRRTVMAGPPAWLHRKGRRSRPTTPLPGGPGTVVVDGLDPATAYDVEVTGPGLRDRRLEVTTLAPPPGRLLAKFATVSDLHIGENRFGFTNTILEGPELGGPSAARCLEAAQAESEAWGAELIVSRGDMTRNSHPQEFAAVARILTSGTVPAVGVLGNHDVRHRIDGPALLAANGLEICTDTQVVDLPGLRLVLGHSPLPTQHRGHLPAERISRLAELCGTAPGGADGRPGPAAVVLHHPLTDRRVLTPYPPGVPADESARLGAALLAANPATVVLAGHRHRNRRRTIAGVTVAEVGSTKDYPGQWAGYAVYEGGILQVVRRVADPVALAWTEATASGIWGLWGRWSPGTLADRCWTQAW